MTSLPKALLILGILLTAGGVAGTGFFYRQMKTENLKHARTGDIPLALAASGGWRSAGFNVFREGTHTIALSLANSGRAGSRPGPYQGTIEIEVTAPDGTPAYRGGVTPAIDRTPGPGANVLFRIDSFAVAAVSEAPWTMRARVTSADTAFTGLSAELSVFPPQLYDIEEYLSGKIVTLICMGLMAVTGFVVVVFSAHLGRRATGGRSA